MGIKGKAMRFTANGWYKVALLIIIILPFARCAPVKQVPPRPSNIVLYKTVAFHADFDSGNLETVEAIDAHQFLIKPRPDYGKDDLLSRLYLGPLETPWNGRTWWYHFSVSIPERHLPYAIRLHIDRSREFGSSAYASDKVPVTSCDGKAWRYVRKWKVNAESSTITETLTCPRTYFALATPYPWAQMEHYIRHLETAPHVKTHDVFAHTPLGVNQDSLPLYYLLITDGTSPHSKRNIVVVSGQHPGEVANAWMVRGMITFLLSEGDIAHALRQHFAFHIYPAVNPEGVKYGYYRRSADSPLNPNRAWGSDKLMEIKTVREHILMQTGGTVDYFFDLHGSMRHAHFIYYFVDQPCAAAYVDAVHRRYAAVSNHSQGGIKHKFTCYDAFAYRWAMKHLRTSRSRDEPPLSFTPEGAYTQGSWDNPPQQMMEVMAAGAALLKAIYDVDLYLPRN